MTHDEMIAVIQAHKDGKEIQLRYKTEAEWSQCRAPWWDFGSCDYRVKPEPREWWIWPDLPYSVLDYKPVNSGYIHVREVLP